jgi:hypothetical protein
LILAKSFPGVMSMRRFPVYKQQIKVTV